MSASAPGPEAGVSRLRAALSAGEMSATDLTRRTLDRIQQSDGPINAWLRLSEEQAMAAAAAVDQRRAAGEPLCGVCACRHAPLLLSVAPYCQTGGVPHGCAAACCWVRTLRS